MIEQENNIEQAVKVLKSYINTYPHQAGYKDYSLETYINDILYGLAISINSDYSFAEGSRKFELELKEYLGKDND